MRYLAFSCALLGASNAYAAPVDAAASLGQIVVTAARTPITLDTAGSGTSVITREDIERRNPAFISELLRDEPGFSLNRSGGTGQQTQLRIRGGEADHVLVLIDGVEANDLTRGGGFDFAHLPASDVERVEIVRGPQSALWGSDAISGVINIITRQGDAKPAASVAVEGGALGTFRTNAAVSGARAGLDGALAISHFESEGINLSPTGREDDGYRNTTLNAKAGWDARPDLRLELTGRVTGARVNNDYANGIPADTTGKTTLLQAYTQFRVRHDSFDGAWRNELSGNWSRMHNDDLDGESFVDAEVTGDKYKAQYQSSLRANSVWLLPASHVLSVAFDYEQQRFSQRGPVMFGYDPRQDRDYQVLGYIGEYRLTLAEHTSLTASGRFDDSDAFADVGTWRVALTQLMASTDTLVSWSYATGQKAPTFFDRYGYSAAPPGDPVFLGNNALRPEQSRGWEIGLQQPLLAQRVQLGVTYFNETLTDEIDGFVYQASTNSFSAENRPGSSHRQGVEFTGRLQLTPQWDARLAYTWLDATEIDGASGKRQAEIRRAPHALAASTAYRSADRRGLIDLHLNHSGAQQDDSFLPPFYTPQRQDLAPYTLIGIAGRYQLTPTLALNARVENALDERYQEIFGYQTEGITGYVGFTLQLPR